MALKSEKAIITVDRNFVIVSWDGGAEAIYGWSANEVIGRSIKSVTRLDTLSVIGYYGMQASHTEGTFTARGVDLDKNGAEILVETQIIIVKNGGYILITQLQ